MKRAGCPCKPSRPHPSCERHRPPPQIEAWRQARQTAVQSGFRLWRTSDGKTHPVTVRRIESSGG